MDDLTLMIDSCRALARLGFTDDEIEVVKRYARETPIDGHSAAGTIAQAVAYLQQNPKLKEKLLENAAKPVDVRLAEKKLLIEVVPLIRQAAAGWPEETVETALIAELKKVLEAQNPDASPARREEAFLAAWSVSPRTGWSFDAAKAVEVLLRPEAGEPVA